MPRLAESPVSGPTNAMENSLPPPPLPLAPVDVVFLSLLQAAAMSTTAKRPAMSRSLLGDDMHFPPGNRMWSARDTRRISRIGRGECRMSGVGADLDVLRSRLGE